MLGFFAKHFFYSKFAMKEDGMGGREKKVQEI